MINGKRQSLPSKIMRKTWMSPFTTSSTQYWMFCPEQQPNGIEIGKGEGSYLYLKMIQTYI